MKTFRILSTKKLDATVKQDAIVKGLDITETEFISIRNVHSEALVSTMNALAPQTHYVVFTSANAVNAVADLARQGADLFVNSPWKVFTLPGKTLEAVQKRFPGMEIVATSPDSSRLAQAIVAQGVKQVVFFCGNQRREELPELLRSRNVQLQEVMVYETIATPQVETASYEAVLFFSPSAVQSFFSVNQLSNATTCFAIGHTTAASIADFCSNRVIVSESPTQEAMLQSVNFYLHNINLYQ